MLFVSSQTTSDALVCVFTNDFRCPCVCPHKRFPPLFVSSQTTSFRCCLCPHKRLPPLFVSSQTTSALVCVLTNDFFPMFLSSFCRHNFIYSVFFMHMPKKSPFTKKNIGKFA